MARTTARSAMPSPDGNGPLADETPERVDPLFVSSLEKGLRVLRAFDEDHASLGLGEIAALTGLDKSAAQRFSHTLHRLGYLEKDPVTRRFRPARRLMEMAFAYQRHNRIAELAMPRLIEAGRQHQITVNLAEPDWPDIIYTVRIPHQEAPYIATVPGRRVPAFATSSGRAMMAGLPEADVDAILASSDLVGFTPKTITDPAAIRRAVARARRDGFASTVEQLMRHEMALSAPVLNHAGRAIAAVQIPVYMSRWTEKRMREELAPVAMETARAISGMLDSTE